jgi:hypothetical protein
MSAGTVHLPIRKREILGHPRGDPAAIYRLEHEEMGASDCFLVPIGLYAEGMRYQAVFT